MGVWYRMALGVLATWRVTHLLHAEDGPWKVVARFRRVVKAVNGELFDCFYCLSVWVAIPFALLLGDSPLECGLLIAALSGAAILVERVTAPAPAPPMPNYVEDSEVPNGMLWKEPNGSGDSNDDGRGAP